MAILGHGKREDGIGNPPVGLFPQARKQRLDQAVFEEGQERGLVAEGATQLDASQERLARPFPPVWVCPVEAEQPAAQVVVNHVRLSEWAVQPPLEDRKRFIRRQGAERLGCLPPQLRGGGVVDCGPVGVLGRFGVSLARQPAAVARHDQLGLGRFEVTSGVGAAPQGSEVAVGLGDTQPQANPQRLTIRVL
jgi:hypothetical protein